MTSYTNVYEAAACAVLTVNDSISGMDISARIGNDTVGYAPQVVQDEIAEVVRAVLRDALTDPESGHPATRRWLRQMALTQALVDIAEAEVPGAREKVRRLIGA